MARAAAIRARVLRVVAVTDAAAMVPVVLWAVAGPATRAAQLEGTGGAACDSNRDV